VSTPEDIAQNEHAPITRAKAPVSGISVPAHLGIGSDLVDPLDYVVLIQVMFDVSAGLRVTPLQVWERLQARGIRSTKHHSDLVGKNSVYDSFNRIIDAGYMRRFNQPNVKHPGRKGPVGYEVYDNPAWNPAWQAKQVGADPLTASEEPQVGMRPQYRDDLQPEASRDGKAAGRNASPVPGSGNSGSGNQGRGSRAIPAGRNASPVPGSPPHPPVGGGNTTPSPHKTGKASRRQEQCALHPDDYVPTAAEIAAAMQFLQDLPNKWQHSIDEAREVAPLLASRVHMLGVDLDVLLQIELTAEDPKNPVRSGVRVMPARIRAMKGRKADAPEASQQQGGLVEWCGECNEGEYPAETFQRMVELEDGRVVPCTKCHPKHVRAARN
jgi:hypothetical protein